MERLEVSQVRELLAARDVSSRPALAPVSTGWGTTDEPHGSLVTGRVHEWLAIVGPSECSQLRQSASGWAPALSILVHLAGRAADAGGWAVWIGQRCWPFSGAARRRAYRHLFDHSILIDPPDDAARLWSIDLALRSPAVAVVIADGAGLSMSATRRLQLAAEAGGGLGLLARPPWEVKSLSAAATRWLVQPIPSETDRPRWAIELLRCKGEQPDGSAPRTWAVEVDGEGVVVVPPELVDRPGRTVAQPRRADRSTA